MKTFGSNDHETMAEVEQILCKDLALRERRAGRRERDRRGEWSPPEKSRLDRARSTQDFHLFTDVYERRKFSHFKFILKISEWGNNSQVAGGALNPACVERRRVVNLLLGCCNITNSQKLSIVFHGFLFIFCYKKFIAIVAVVAVVVYCVIHCSH